MVCIIAEVFQKVCFLKRMGKRSELSRGAEVAVYCYGTKEKVIFERSE